MSSLLSLWFLDLPAFWLVRFVPCGAVTPVPLSCEGWPGSLVLCPWLSPCCVRSGTSSCQSSLPSARVWFTFGRGMPAPGGHLVSVILAVSVPTSLGIADWLTVIRWAALGVP